MPVPGDLPVFLELALTVVAAQHHAHRVATLVVPDEMTGAMARSVSRHRSGWAGPLEVVALPRPERWVLPRLKSGSRNHGLQLIAGVGVARSSHVVLHDADLFLLDPGTLDDRYTECRDRGLACLGLDPVWDPWFAQHGRELAATWDMCARVDWLRDWPPHLHMGHDGELWGELHTFDTTLYAQALTSPGKIAVSPRPHDFVHFNYVISTYRLFQRRGELHDDQFRLLFIRVLVDLFDRNTAYSLPTSADLAAGLDGRGAVTYPSAAAGGADYAAFRSRLDAALSGVWATAAHRRDAASALAPFDEFFGAALSA